MNETQFNNDSMQQQCDELGHVVKSTEIESNEHIVLELSKICRVCLLACNDLRSLFDDEPYCISDMIMTFVPIQLSPDDSLPSKICSQCASHVSRAVTVKQQIETAEATLRNFITVGYLDVKMQPDEEADTFLDKPFEQLNTDNDSVIHEHILKEKDDTTIVPSNEEYLVDQNEQQLTNDNHEEECDFVEVRSTQLDEVKSKTVVSSRHVPKRVDRNVKKKRKKETIKNTSSWICKICDKKFSDIRRYNRHSKTHDDEKQHRCQTCNKGFNERADLSRHIERHIKSQDATQDENYNCPDCHMSFKVQNDLKIHQSVHRNDGKIICCECNKEFSTKIQLKRHIRTHYVDKPHKCSVCDKGFPEMGSLTRHFKKHTGEVREKKFECVTCGKRYFDSHSLGVHNRKHSGEKPWSCGTCGKSFIDLRLLNSHKKIHMDFKPHACEFCDKRFTHQSTLTTHMRTHTNEKPYICSWCGKSFIQSSNLSLHIRVHTGEKPYKCTTCERCFASSSTLTMHRRVHSGGIPESLESNLPLVPTNYNWWSTYNCKACSPLADFTPYNCTVCSKSFARHDLSAHMRTHTGEKPYLCTTCNKRFTTSGQLNQHVRTHSGEKPYVCDKCHKACSSSTYLKKHKKNCRQNLQLQNISSQEEYIEITSLPTTHDDHNLPNSESIILTEVAENNETYYVRIDGNQLIHQIIDSTLDEHSLVNLNQSGDVEILNDIIPVVQNGLSDNGRVHIVDKQIYHTGEPNCMRMQVDPNDIDDVSNSIRNQHYFLTSDCTK